MLNAKHHAGTDSHFVEGNRGLLVLMGHRFLITITGVEMGGVRVSFPVQDFPMEGMYVTLEFHDELGYSTYETEVLKSPEGPGDGLLLSLPPESNRTHHRSTWRVSADFNVEMKSHVHPRRVEAPVINISSGGMLVRTNMNLNMDDNVDLAFSLPGDSHKSALAKVVHIHLPEHSQVEHTLIGLQFVSPEQVFTKSLTHYIWRRLRQLHPQEHLRLRRHSDQV